MLTFELIKCFYRNQDPTVAVFSYNECFTNSSVHLLFLYCKNLSTWCRATYQILIPLPWECGCPWMWLMGCSRLSRGSTAECWESRGAEGLQLHGGLNPNVQLSSLHSITDSHLQASPVSFLSSLSGSQLLFMTLFTAALWHFLATSRFRTVKQPPPPPSF